MGGKGATTGTTDNPFWDFSLSVYGRPGVAPACLALQDRRGLDVNVLLFCAWAGSRGHSLAAQELADLMAAAGPWQDQVVAPLRALRRHLKAMGPSPRSPVARLRRRIKAAELAAEAIEQEMLAARIACAEGAGSPAVASANMMAYLAALGIAPDAADVADLAVVVQGCDPAVRPLQAVWAVAGSAAER